VEAIVSRMQNFTSHWNGFSKKKMKGAVTLDFCIIAIDDDEGDKLYRVLYNDDDEEEIDEAGMKELLKNQADTISRLVGGPPRAAADEPKSSARG
jgi:hypothetical protein